MPSRKPSTGRKTVKKVLRLEETEAMPRTMALESLCTLREAEACKLALHAAEDSSGDFVLDAGAVERIDTAVLQLLLAFAARLRVTERRLVWCAVSPAFRQGVRQLGLTQALGLPEAA